MTRRPRSPTLLAGESLERVLDKVLESHFWPQTLSASSSHFRIHDDNDGDPHQVLAVHIAHDGDVWVLPSEKSLRFRAPLGGGMSPRVRNALLVLAEAIRRDNEAMPRGDPDVRRAEPRETAVRPS